MADQLLTLTPLICGDSRDAISSPASRGGTMRSYSPDGLPTAPCGPARAHVSLSALRAREAVPETSDTFGLSSLGSSPSADLQRFLENRLQARTAGCGSPLYALTWKTWAISSGPRICALRALAPRTSGSACGGWATPLAQRNKRSEEFRKGREPSPEEVGIVGWPTPTYNEFDCDLTKDIERRSRLKAEWRNGNGAGTSLSMAAKMAGLGTPRAVDVKGLTSRETALKRANEGIANICDQVALVPTGWATPRVTNNGGNGNPERSADGKARLEDQVQGAAGWQTPKASDVTGSRAERTKKGEWRGIGLSTQAESLTGWSTPSTRDWKDTPGMATEGTNPGRIDQVTHGSTAEASAWGGVRYIGCADGKARPVEPGVFPVAHGVRGRVGRLRAYGNAIVPQVAAEFIGAFMECRP